MNKEISRVTRTKEEASRAYDRISRWYDRLASSSEQPLTDIGLRRLNIRRGESVLEIGCGTGRALIELASAVGIEGHVTGIDLSRGMLSVALERTIRAGLAQRITLEHGDASAMAFQDNTFDAVFVSFALELFDTPEISIVLSECKRVLKPGGRIGVVALARDEYESIHLRIYEWFHRTMPVYVDCRPIYVRRVLEEADFSIQEIIRKKMWGLPVVICVAVALHLSLGKR